MNIAQGQPVHSIFGVNTPVGQNIALARDEASAFRYPSLPTEVAVKNFMAVRPFASRSTISDVVVAPGKKWPKN